MTRPTALERQTMRWKDYNIVRALDALDTSCMRCGYDEAEGGLVNHCNACCRKIVAALWLVRTNARRRLAKPRVRQKARKSAKAKCP